MRSLGKDLVFAFKHKAYLEFPFSYCPKKTSFLHPQNKQVFSLEDFQFLKLP